MVSNYVGDVLGLACKPVIAKKGVLRFAWPYRDPQRNARTKRKAAPADLAEASSGSEDNLDALDHSPEDNQKSSGKK